MEEGSLEAQYSIVRACGVRYNRVIGSVCGFYDQRRRN